MTLRQRAARPPAMRIRGVRDPRRFRNGAALVIALVCLTIAGMTMVAIVRLSLLEQQSMQRELRRLQTVWLADSAVNRAVVRLAADPDFTRETWQPWGDAADSPRAQIEILPSEPAGAARTISVIADDSADNDRRIRIRREMDWQQELQP